MRKVRKYRIPEERTFVLKLPAGAKILGFLAPFDEPHLWALIDDESPSVHRHFMAVDDGAVDARVVIEKFVGSVQLYKGMRVIHLFEVQGG